MVIIKANALLIFSFFIVVKSSTKNASFYSLRLQWTTATHGLAFGKPTERPSPALLTHKQISFSLFPFLFITGHYSFALQHLTQFITRYLFTYFLTVYLTMLQSPWTGDSWLCLSQHLLDTWHIANTQYIFLKWMNTCKNEEAKVLFS